MDDGKFECECEIQSVAVLERFIYAKRTSPATKICLLYILFNLPQPEPDPHQGLRVRTASDVASFRIWPKSTSEMTSAATQREEQHERTSPDDRRRDEKQPHESKGTAQSSWHQVRDRSSLLPALRVPYAHDSGDRLAPQLGRERRQVGTIAIEAIGVAWREGNDQRHLDAQMKRE